MRYDVIIIGGGLAALTAGISLLDAGLRVASVAGGASLHKLPLVEYVKKGGIFFPGDYVVDSQWEGRRLLSVKSGNFADMRLDADYFILASGKFFSRGLLSDRRGVYEPLFNLDIQYDADRNLWFSDDFFASQQFENYGVIYSDDMRAIRYGQAVDNLYVAGEILYGINSVAGVDGICETALKAAAAIVEARKNG